MRTATIIASLAAGVMADSHVKATIKTTGDGSLMLNGTQIILTTGGANSLDISAVPGMFDNVHAHVAKVETDLLNLEKNVTKRLEGLGEDVENLEESTNNVAAKLESQAQKQNTDVVVIKASVAENAASVASNAESVANNAKLSTTLSTAFKAFLACAKDGKEYDDVAAACIEPTRQTFSVPGQYWNDVRTNNNLRWQNTRRDVNYIRSDPKSVMRVTYQDSLGFYNRGSTVSCRWRMSFDGQAKRALYMHSNAGRWSIDAQTNIWILPPNEIPNNIGNTNPSWYKVHAKEETQKSMRISIESYRDKGSYSCLQGWPSGRQDNSIIVEELDATMMVERRNMGEKQVKSANWETIADRRVIYTPKADGSLLEVTLSDAIGLQMATSARDGCTTRLVMNGQDVSPNKYYVQQSENFKNKIRLQPQTFTWRIPAASVKKGTKYTFDIQNKKGAGAAKCYYGWKKDLVENVLYVEEITTAKQAMSATTKLNSFTDVRATSTGFADVKGRTVAYTKKEANSVMKITLSDNLGWDGSGRSSWSCILRVLVNKKTYNIREMTSHSTSARGLHVQPKTLTFVCTSCPKGSNVYQLQVRRDRNNGAKQCILGGVKAGTPGFLKVEEIQAPLAF